MSGCIIDACAKSCADPCTITALTDRIDALEKALKPPEPQGLAELLDYMVSNAGNLIILFGGGLAIGLVIWWFKSGGAKRLTLKSAELSPTGASFAFEAANVMLDHLQDHVVEAAANAAEASLLRSALRANPTQAAAEVLKNVLLPPDRAAGERDDASLAPGFAAVPKEPEKPFVQTSFADKLPRKTYDPLTILWCLADAEARPFERRVITAMGNQIDIAIGPKAAKARLSGGAAYDLVITDATAPETDDLGGLDLARNLMLGIPGSPDIEPLFRAKVGPATRLAILTSSDSVDRVARELAIYVARLKGSRPAEVVPNYLVTADFGDLRRSVRWAQKQKTEQTEK